MSAEVAGVTSTRASKLRLPQFLGYAAGDAGNNVAFSMMGMFLLIYYTDVVGISATVAGTIFLLIRIWDAVSDLLAGRLVDRTMTRFGKFRPFFLFGGVPLAVLTIATFTLPGLVSGGTGVKIILAVVTYGLAGTAYSMVNIPYGSLASAMTQDPSERAKLASFRMIGAAATVMVLSFIVSPQIKRFSGEPEQFQHALLITMIALGIAAVLLYLFLFATSRERVERGVGHVSAKQSFETLKHNKPLVMLCLSSLAVLTGMTAIQTLGAYYARDIMHNADLFIVLTVLYSGSIFLVGPFIPKVVRTFGKKKGYLGFVVIAVIGGVLVSLAPLGSLALPFIGYFLYGIGTSGINSLMWALEADTVEFGEWKTGVRTEGITYATFSFTRKLGQSIGGAVAAYGIAIGGYVAGQSTQTSHAILSIRIGTGFLPAAFFVIGFIIFFAYPLNEQTFAAMVAEIRRRRINQAAKSVAAE